MASTTKKFLKSTWTPLSNEETNNKVYEERRVLIGKWFDKWNSAQRKNLLSDILGKCKLKQAEFTAELLKKRVPVYHQDFTQVLPRVISLYIFSFLDPRSLCRCSTVSWYWKYISELDQIWMSKSLKLGWYLTFVPSPYESGIWKQNYIENIKGLHYLQPKEPQECHPPIDDLSKLDIETDRLEANTPHSNKKPPLQNESGKISKRKPPPWKGSDPVPKDIWRYNYLSNEDEVEKVNVLRKSGKYSKEASEISHQAKSKVKTGKNILTVKPKRSQSLPRITPEEQHPNMGRPSWAQHHDGQPYIQVGAIGDSDCTNASVRPPPIHKSVLRKVDNIRSQPSPLFREQPWQVPPMDDYDSDEQQLFYSQVVKQGVSGGLGQ